MVWYGGMATSKIYWFKAVQLAGSKMLHIREQEKHMNRDILSRLTDIIVYLARQGIAFRGDD